MKTETETKIWTKLETETLSLKSLSGQTEKLPEAETIETKTSETGCRAKMPETGDIPETETETETET